jgi:hypothetical protein
MTHLKLVSNNSAPETETDEKEMECQLTLPFRVVRLAGATAPLVLPSRELEAEVNRWAASQPDPRLAAAYAMGFLITRANGGGK